MLQSLGLIVLRFSGLEFCTERLLLSFVSGSYVDLLVVAGQDMSWKLDRLSQVLEEVAPTEATERLKSWVGGVEELNRRRNRLIHSVWTTGPNGAPIGFNPKRRGKWDGRGMPVTANMLVDLSAQIRAATADAVAISAMLEGHPDWHGRPLDEADEESEASTD
jgi:hypothetical protein